MRQILWLLIVGGGSIDGEIREEFIRLAGGPDAPIVVIPTASGRKDHDDFNSGLQGWKAAGATNLTVLHTTDPSIADTKKFVEPIREARAVWIGGGPFYLLFPGDTYNLKIRQPYQRSRSAQPVLKERVSKAAKTP